MHTNSTPPGNGVRMEAVNCPLCGSDQRQLRYIGKDRLTNVPGDFLIVECAACHLLYLSPRPVEMAPFYDGSYLFFEAAIGQGAWKPLLQLLRERLGRGQASQPQRQVAGPANLYLSLLRQTGVQEAGRLLDFGCGVGDFLLALRDTQWEIHGYDATPAAAQRTNARLGETDRTVVRSGDFFNAFPSQYFDVVTLWHVIEHLPDPVATMSEIWRILRPGGLCIVQTPRLDSLEATLFGPYWGGLDSPRHLCVFSAATLVNLLVKTGYTDFRHLNHNSCGVFLVSMMFWLNAISDGLGMRFYRFSQRSLPSRLFYYAFMALDALKLGAQITVMMRKPQ